MPTSEEITCGRGACALRADRVARISAPVWRSSGGRNVGAYVPRRKGPRQRRQSIASGCSLQTICIGQKYSDVQWHMRTCDQWVAASS